MQDLLESYLSRLEMALSALPVEERREILLETRMHLVERSADGSATPIADVLRELGPAEEYALRFLPESENAPHDRRPGMLATLASAPRRGLLLMVVAIGYSVATLFAVIALWKLLAPDQIGFWINESGGARHYAIGVADPPQPGKEILGHWLTVSAAAIALGIHMSIAALIRRVGRRQKS